MLEFAVPITLAVCVLVLGIFFGAAYIATKKIKSAQEQKRRESLPESGNDSSDFADYLSEKYRNDRIEGNL